MITTERTRVRMLAAVSGMAMPTYDIHSEFSHSLGDAVDLHPTLAEAWVKCGHAERVQEESTKKAK